MAPPVDQNERKLGNLMPVIERDAVKRAEDRYDAVRAAWVRHPTPANARRLDHARAAMFTERRRAAESNAR